MKPKIIALVENTVKIVKVIQCVCVNNWQENSFLTEGSLCTLGILTSHTN